MQAVHLEGRATRPATADVWATRPGAAAEQVLNQHWNGMLPVDPVAIASRMGIRVVAIGTQAEPWEYSGYFKKYDATYDGPVILVNRADGAMRQRFTIAHELGHYVLQHEDAPRDYPSQFSSSVGDPKERAANQFAAELLMPASAVRKVVESGRMQHVEELAQAFQVSPVAMNYRLTNLNLASW